VTARYRLLREARRQRGIDASSVVLARLPASSYVSHYRFVWTAACRSNLTTRIWYGAAFAVFVLTEYLQSHPKLASPVRQAFVDWLSR
jgi:hypothetical protein